MARPQSAQRVALLKELDQGSGTSRELARRAGVDDVLAIRRLLENMVRGSAPEAVVLRMERVPGCKRPVPVYGRLHTAPAVSSSDGIGAAFAQLGLALFGSGGMEGAAA